MGFVGTGGVWALPGGVESEWAARLTANDSPRFGRKTIDHSAWPPLPKRSRDEPTINNGNGQPQIDERVRHVLPTENHSLNPLISLPACMTCPFSVAKPLPSEVPINTRRATNLVGGSDGEMKHYVGFTASTTHTQATRAAAL